MQALDQGSETKYYRKPARVCHPLATAVFAATPATARAAAGNLIECGVCIFCAPGASSVGKFYTRNFVSIDRNVLRCPRGTAREPLAGGGIRGDIGDRSG